MAFAEVAGLRVPFYHQMHQSSVHRHRGWELDILRWTRGRARYHTVGGLGWDSSSPAGMVVRWS